MKVTVDTNVLLRAAVPDDLKQFRAASELLQNETSITVSLPCLCEFAWALRSAYKFQRAEIAAAIEELIQANNVAVSRPAVEAGLAMLYAGGDFADGILAFEGRQVGAETFISFDKDAVKFLTKQGHKARLLS
ncbi:type II toxin-antitoxin system VapC family toxin [Terracidiphilus gabretensis]|uniref:type II toxin-antitoxin system VapC family toxin n=1 Tax=Terracidiphilus gabretensis TaxID=1577687 RepID=UPI00071B2D24|nr:type II toxin-antitoxin system VapC family toxin [Terracidiphilus gabretensis]